MTAQEEYMDDEEEADYRSDSEERPSNRRRAHQSQDRPTKFVRPTKAQQRVPSLFGAALA